MSATQIKEMMENFVEIESNVRRAYPGLGEEQVFQLTKQAMNASLGLVKS